jgi:hypothetical protein
MIRVFRFAADQLGRLFAGGAHFTRIHERLPCAVWSKLHFIDRGFSSVGIVDEVSQGGMRFRPAQNYICMRMGDVVRIQAGDYNIEATIVNTTEQGYGLRLKKPIEQDDMEAFVAASDRESLAA